MAIGRTDQVTNNRHEEDWVRLQTVVIGRNGSDLHDEGESGEEKSSQHFAREALSCCSAANNGPEIE